MDRHERQGIDGLSASVCGSGRRGADVQRWISESSGGSAPSRCAGATVEHFCTNANCSRPQPIVPCRSRQSWPRRASTSWRSSTDRTATTVDGFCRSHTRLAYRNRHCPIRRFSSMCTTTRPVSGLAFDHADMVRLAVTDLRTRYASYVDPDGLSGGTFTVAELRRLYEVIFDRPFQKDSFRRQVLDALESTGEMSRPGNGRPAETYRRRGEGALTAQAMAFLTG